MTASPSLSDEDIVVLIRYVRAGSRLTGAVMRSAAEREKALAADDRLVAKLTLLWASLPPRTLQTVVDTWNNVQSRA